MRKTVWIPLAAMADRPERALLELIVERGAWPAEADSGLSNLNVYGLGNAAQMAQKAVLHGKLLPHFSWGNSKAAPYCYAANPVSALSNTHGAALGIALGLLMYEGVLPNHALIACGSLQCSANSARVPLQTVDKIEEKLELATTLGRQEHALGFVVPAYTREGLGVKACFMSRIRALAELNIRVLPVATLQEAVTACRMI